MNKEGRCAIKFCRNEGDVYHIDKWLCDLHWDKLCDEGN